MPKKNDEDKKKGLLPSGKYRYRLYIGTGPDGKKKYKSFTADSLKKARKAAESWQSLHPSSGSEISLNEACERFLEVRSNTLSPSTWSDYRNRITYLQERFPDLFKASIQAVNTERMQWLVNTLANKVSDKNRTKPISAKTVKSYYSLLETILHTNGIRIDNIQLPQYQKPDLNIPEEDQVKELLASVAGTALEIPILLAALGPMRRGEICALTMDDIDFDQNIVHVRKSMVRNNDGSYSIKQPKSEAGNRDILYPAAVIQKIQEQGYVTHCNPGTISRNFIRHLERHDLPVCRFHDLRHYAASFLLALNIPPVYVMERGGWQSDQTMKRYVHALDKQRKEYAEQASAAFNVLL